jgi:hypothetical protein
LLASALEGATFVSLREDRGRLLLEGRRGIRSVHVRFLGVREQKLPEPSPDAAVMRVKAVGQSGSLVRRLLMGSHAMNPSRVTIQAGDAEIEIVCEDAEWWED